MKIARDLSQACRDAMITADVILPGRPMTGRGIAEQIALRHGLTLADLLGKSAKRDVAWPRQEAFAAIRDRLEWSYPRIAALFGCDHSTVIYGVSQHRWRNPPSRGVSAPPAAEHEKGNPDRFSGLRGVPSQQVPEGSKPRAHGGHQ